MAIRKVCGIETEYGIVVRGADNNPVTASSLLINAYVNATSKKVGWDFEDESPANDARGFNLDDVFPPEIESSLVNAVLPNGARYYVDHAHPEISLPEVTDALDAVRWDRAADEIVRASMGYANEILGDGAEVIVYKNNSDGKGNSYGCHENYLMSRETPFGKIASHVTPHFVTRQIFCGAGKVGCEEPGRLPGEVAYQLSQRADFFEEEIGLETTLKRPIVNTRDEPHCDPQKYRRLHVIVGDANMSEVATFLKLGTTLIVLAMIEDDALGDDLLLTNAVSAIRAVSHDPALERTIGLRDGRRVTALEIQWALLELARKYEQTHGLEAAGGDVAADVLVRWEQVLTGLERDPDSVGTWVDWVAKRRLVEGFRDRHDLAPDAPKLKAIDLQYHDLRPDRGLAGRSGLEALVSQADATDAMSQPPTTTRAYFRGRCLQKYPDDIVAANWDSMVFDIGRDPLRRVPMMEPLRGTEDHVGNLIDECDTAAVLLERLGQ
ncbi:MAG: proteasome accessory factor PafA2 [Ilumatobacter sp.]|nr:proteasome accessory factor PafA2 [Ilumatobacter sp.]